MNRRAFVAGMAAAVAAPLVGEAQHATKVHRVGVLSYLAADDLNMSLQVFRQALAARGLVAGRNIALEIRSASGRLEALPDLAADLVRRNPDVILAIAPLAIRAARQATSSTPIVMAYGDPAMFSSLARPGGNVTGVAALAAELAGKQMELLKEAVPRLSRAAVLRNPEQPVHTAKLKRVESVARTLGVALIVGDARTADHFDGVFLTFASERADGLIVLADGMFRAHRQRLSELCSRLRLPAVYGSSGHAEAGGLIAYVPDTSEVFRRVASYVDRILRGANPGDLPVEQPTKFNLTVNTSTARTLALTIPPSLLLRADQVIE